MENHTARLSIPAFTFATKNYCLLTKPGIIVGNAITTAGGFALASKGGFNVLLFLVTLLGICLVIASGCVFNNYIDRFADQKMHRTRHRALAAGTISTQRALMFAIGLGLVGTLVLITYANLLTVSIALFGFLVYVILYSLSKYHSIHGTLVGSVAGAVPPVAGYCAMSNRLDMGAWILFFIIVMWQMPHFYAIAMYRIEEYKKAGIPVLPLIKGIRATKIQMVFYIVGFIAIALALVVCNYVGLIYLITVSLLGLTWLALGLKGFYCAHDKVWARQMFVVSLVVVMGLCAAIPFSMA